MVANIHVRAARPRDRQSILSFTQNTFHWGDYIAEVWDKWLVKDKGQLLVAEIKHHAVGLLHISWMGNHEAWMEGMRVHPDFRRHGVAAQLDAAAQALARREGNRVVRLATALENATAQTAIEHLGYRRLASFREWDTPAEPGEANRLRLAAPDELEVLQSLWEHSSTRRAMQGLMPLVEGWRWAEFTRGRLRPWLVHRKVYVTPSRGAPRGFALVNEEQEGFAVLLLVGQTREANTLLAGLRRLTHQRGKGRCWLMLPDNTRTSAWEQANSWGPQTGGMLIYEAHLP